MSNECEWIMRLGKEATKLSAEWPKRCGCGKIYVKNLESYIPSMNAELWSKLEFAYTREDEFGVFEARHCSCNSTLEVLVKIIDLDKE